MQHTRNHLILGAVALAAIAPTAALAAGATAHPALRGSPQMRTIDAKHATLRFASDRLPRTVAGKLDAKITYAGGQRVSGLKASGTHGSDIVYTARVSSTKPMRNHQKFTVRFRLGTSQAVTRKVKLFAPGEHGY
jgi:hypothetical protein